jgi:hypothetical protein
MGKKADADHTPAERAAERARLLKSPSRQVDQARMRSIGEKLGLAKTARLITGTQEPQENREVETGPPQREPTPSWEKPRAGRKRSIPQDQIDRGIGILQNQGKMTVEAARETLRAAGIEGSDSALYRLIIEPSGISK